MLFNIIIGIHIELQLKIFSFIIQLSSKTDKFGMSEILGDRNQKQNHHFMHTWK
jgi:hypothetical protein